MIHYLKRFLLDYIDEIRDALELKTLEETYQEIPLNKSIVQFLENPNVLAIYLLSLPLLKDPKVIIDDGEYYTLLREFYIKNSDQNLIARKLLDQYIVPYQTAGDTRVSIFSEMEMDGDRIGLRAGGCLSIGVTTSADIDLSRQAEYIEFAKESYLSDMSGFSRSFAKKIKGNKK